jgi:hypothetical protein
MELSPRQVAFVKSEMKSIETDETRQPTARVEAERIREQAESALTE